MLRLLYFKMNGHGLLDGNSFTQYLWPFTSFNKRAHAHLLIAFIVWYHTDVWLRFKVLFTSRLTEFIRNVHLRLTNYVPLIDDLLIYSLYCAFVFLFQGQIESQNLTVLVMLHCNFFKKKIKLRFLLPRLLTHYFFREWSLFEVQPWNVFFHQYFSVCQTETDFSYLGCFFTMKQRSTDFTVFVHMIHCLIGGSRGHGWWLLQLRSPWYGLILT